MNCAQMSMLLSDSSCKRVLSLSCGFIFPPMFPVFLGGLLGCTSFRHWLSNVLHGDV